MASGIIHLAADKNTPTGKHTANKSVIAIFAKEKDNSVLSARKNGSNTAQPTTPVIAKYGSAKISNIFNQLQVLQAFLFSKRASKLNVEILGGLSRPYPLERFVKATHLDGGIPFQNFDNGKNSPCKCTKPTRATVGE